MNQAEPSGTLALREYLTVLRTRRVVVLVAVAVLVVPVLALSLLQTPRYSSSAEILLQARTSENLFDANTGVRNDPARTVQNEIRIVKSAPVRDLVRQRLGSAPKASATPILQTDIIRITVTDENPNRAAAAANAYAIAYIDYRRQQAVDDILAAGQQIQGKIRDLQTQIDAAPPEQRSPLVDAQGLFKQKLDQLQVDGALKQGGAQVVTPAVASTTPVSPRPLRSTLFALVLGLVAGVGLAALLEFLDDSVKTKDDLQRAAPGVPVLGLVPVVTGWRAKQDAFLISVAEPTSPVAEAYRTLRTAIQFMALDHPMRTLQVTSANPREGKTTTLANLAIALASTGQKVLVICCDLRRPRIHEFLGLSNEIGFTSALLGKVPLAGAIQRVPDQPGLSLLASGPLPPNPSELLASARTAEVLTTLQGEFDIVLIDSPPILPVTDALVLSGRVDATLLVAIAGTTSRREASRAVELLRQVDAPLVGAVLNGVDSDGSDSYGYQYYRRDTDQPPARNGSAGPGAAKGAGRLGSMKRRLPSRVRSVDRAGRPARTGAVDRTAFGVLAARLAMATALGLALLASHVAGPFPVALALLVGFAIDLRNPLTLKNFLIAYVVAVFGLGIAVLHLAPPSVLGDVTWYLVAFLVAYTLGSLSRRGARWARSAPTIVSDASPPEDRPGSRLSLRALESALVVLIVMNLALLALELRTYGVAGFYRGGALFDQMVTYGQASTSGGAQQIARFALKYCGIGLVVLHTSVSFARATKVRYRFPIGVLVVLPILFLRRYDAIVGALTVLAIYGCERRLARAKAAKDPFAPAPATIWSSLGRTVMVGTAVLSAVVVGLVIGVLRTGFTTTSGVPTQRAGALAIATSELDPVEAYGQIRENISVLGYQKGRTIIEPLFLKVVPRAWFPNKPLNSGAYFMSTLRGPEFDAGYALPPTFFGDAFLSFGFGGALAACFVLGLVAVRLDLAFKNGVLKSVPLFLIAFANFYSLLRDPLSESLAGILLTLLVWFVGGKALRRTDRLAAAPGAAPGRLWPPSGSLALAP